MSVASRHPLGVRHSFVRCWALLCVFGPTLASGQFSDVDRGQQIYVVCGACHGDRAEGEERLNAPSLVGQSDVYLLRQLKNFRDGVRGRKADPQAQEMKEILSSVPSESDWRSALAFVKSLPASRPQPSITGDIENGRRLYASCAACHGVKGEGNETLQTPALRFLPDWYLVAELRKFRTGTRGSVAGDAPGAQMRAASALLRSDQDCRDVATFIAHQ